MWCVLLVEGNAEDGLNTNAFFYFFYMVDFGLILDWFWVDFGFDLD